MKKKTMITPESGRPSGVSITLAWLQIATDAERGDRRRRPCAAAEP